MNRHEILALVKGKAYRVKINGLTAIGGAKSSGYKIKDLHASGDYVISQIEDGYLSMHQIVGSSSQKISLAPWQFHQAEDLILVNVPDLSDGQQIGDFEGFVSLLSQLIQRLGERGGLDVSLNLCLESLSKLFGMNLGLVVAMNSKKNFEVVCSRGIADGQAWLSESVIQEVLSKGRAVFVKNLIGSPYENSKSLSEEGFLSVGGWPLKLRGQMVGVLMLGSDRPHSGLTSSQEDQARIFTQLAAMLLDFYLRDEQLSHEVQRLRNSQKGQKSPITTEDVDLRKTCQMAAQVASSDLSVLVQGETGVGKEVMAQWIHQNSDRLNQPFIAVNCGAIPGELLESLLFGHMKGSFTHAVKDQQGKFELAHKGTIFLDEVGDLPMHLQVKLLRVLQTKSVEPLGATRPKAVDVKVIAASHKNLRQMIKTNEFREDLYYRLAEITLEIPPLRDRIKDIPILATEFLAEYAPDKKFSSAAWQFLRQYPWPGNVRELKSSVKRASVLSLGDTIEIEHLMLGQRDETDSALDHNWLGGKDLREAKANFVKTKIQKALELSEDNRQKAAQLLGVNARTLFRYMESPESQ